MSKIRIYALEVKKWDNDAKNSKFERKALSTKPFTLDNQSVISEISYLDKMKSGYVIQNAAYEFTQEDFAVAMLSFDRPAANYYLLLSDNCVSVQALAETEAAQKKLIEAKLIINWMVRDPKRRMMTKHSQEYSWAQGLPSTTVKIGRDPKSDILVETAARMQGVIEINEQGIFYIDLGAEPRSKINQQFVSKLELFDFLEYNLEINGSYFNLIVKTKRQ